MTVFRTPEAISVLVEFGIGDLCLVASESTETAVEVRPNDPAKKADVTAASETQVEYSAGSLVVRGPKNWRQWAPFGPSAGRESIYVEIRLPVGSRVNVNVSLSAVRSSGRLGETDIKTGMGDVRVDEAASARIRTGFGEVTIGRVDGDIDVKTGSGRIEIGSVKGSATIKNANGESRIGEVDGRAKLQNANGTIHVDSARSDVTAKTAFGDVRLGELSNGTTDAKTACGQIDIGVLDGVAAWLDVATGFGRVDNKLEDTSRPPADTPTAEIHARTAAGNITIRRVSSGADMASTS